MNNKKEYFHFTKCGGNDSEVCKCSDIAKKDVNLQFTLYESNIPKNGSKDSKKQYYYTLTINIEKYFIDDTVNNACIIPIFTTAGGKARLSEEIRYVWLLGNMFLDRYFVVNDMSQAV